MIFTLVNKLKRTNDKKVQVDNIDLDGYVISTARSDSKVSFRVCCKEDRLPDILTYFTKIMGRCNSNEFIVSSQPPDELNLIVYLKYVKAMQEGLDKIYNMFVANYNTHLPVQDASLLKDLCKALGACYTLESELHVKYKAGIQYKGKRADTISDIFGMYYKNVLNIQESVPVNTGSADIGRSIVGYSIWDNRVDVIYRIATGELTAVSYSDLRYPEKISTRKVHSISCIARRDGIAYKEMVTPVFDTDIYKTITCRRELCTVEYILEEAHSALIHWIDTSAISKAARLVSKMRRDLETYIEKDILPEKIISNRSVMHLKEGISDIKSVRYAKVKPLRGSSDTELWVICNVGEYQFPRVTPLYGVRYSHTSEDMRLQGLSGSIIQKMNNTTGVSPYFLAYMGMEHIVTYRTNLKGGLYYTLDQELGKYDIHVSQIYITFKDILTWVTSVDTYMFKQAILEASKGTVSYIGTAVPSVHTYEYRHDTYIHYCTDNDTHKLVVYTSKPTIIYSLREVYPRYTTQCNSELLRKQGHIQAMAELAEKQESTGINVVTKDCASWLSDIPIAGNVSERIDKALVKRITNKL